MQEMLVKDRLEAVLCSRSRGAEIKWPPGPGAAKLRKAALAQSERKDRKRHRKKKIKRFSPSKRVQTANMSGYDICRDSVKQRKHTHQETEPYVLYCTGTRIVSDNHIS